MTENKQQIADKLCELLKLTNRLSDIDRIEYIHCPREGENACIYLENRGSPYRIVDVSGDSGIAMIKDILEAI